ncbi:MAG: hypothetical protein HY208_03800 [Nitrospirae bacterium]|nr:hypothetical protein [Nitrospirota bacterium]
MIIVIAAVIVLFQTRRQADLAPSTRAVILLVIGLGGGLLWYMWFGPGSSPPPPPPMSKAEIDARFKESQTALPTDTPEAIIQKLGCAVCHKIPGVPHATVGHNGPVLMLKTTAPQRLASAAYQARVKAGLAHATTPMDYVIESIMEPDAFYAPGYDPATNPTVIPMYAHYKDRFTPEALQFLVLFLLQLDEELARKEGLLNHESKP